MGVYGKGTKVYGPFKEIVFQTLSNRFCTKMFELISLDFKCLLIETLLSKD